MVKFLSSLTLRTSESSGSNEGVLVFPPPFFFFLKTTRKRKKILTRKSSSFFRTDVSFSLEISFLICQLLFSKSPSPSPTYLQTNSRNNSDASSLQIHPHQL